MSDRLAHLIAVYLDERITADELAELEESLRTSPGARERFLRAGNLHAALDDLALAETAEPSTARRVAVDRPNRTSRFARWGWVTAAGLVAVVVLAVLLVRPGDPSDVAVATVTGISGPLQWTGDGGRVRDDLAVGATIPAGTVEGTSPRSWLELAFEDGTKVSVAGRSRLVVAESERKELRLHAGTLFADVRPQAEGRSLVVRTPTATLDVLGTQFRVEADAYATAMTVSEGNVRVVRSTDGHAVDVAAGHRVVVAADRDLRPDPEPVVTNRWRSAIELGPEHALGRWRPPSGTDPARLGSVPFTTEEEFVVHAVGLGVSRCDGDVVVLERGTHLRMRGSLGTPHAVFFGITVRHPNGDFAGRFQTVLPKDRFAADEPFEVRLDVAEFDLDPVLEPVRDRLPREPFGLVVESVWCHTLWDPVGLTVSEAALEPPMPD